MNRNPASPAGSQISLGLVCGRSDAQTGAFSTVIARPLKPRPPPSPPSFPPYSSPVPSEQLLEAIRGREKKVTVSTEKLQYETSGFITGQLPGGLGRRRVVTGCLISDLGQSEACSHTEPPVTPLPSTGMSSSQRSHHHKSLLIGKWIFTESS